MRQDERRFRGGVCVFLAVAACAPGKSTETSSARRASTGSDPTGGGDPLGGAPLDLTAAPATAGVGTIAGGLQVDAIGNATYSLSFQPVPGTYGMAPSGLGLSYSSAAGNGLVGVGFRLSGFSTISRCGKSLADDGKIEPISFTAADAYCLDGMRLVITSGFSGLNGTTYVPRVGNRTQIVGHGSTDSTASWFEVRLPDGSIAEYGHTDDSRESQPVGTQTRVRTWWLSSIRDPYDHAMNYRYGWNVRGGARVNFRPMSIDYGLQGGVPTRQVAFGYVPRADPITGYFGGAPTATEWRLSLVHMIGPEGLARQYRLEYADQTEDADDESLTGRSLLRAVQECTNSVDECKPRTWFAWQQGELGFDHEDTLVSNDEVPLQNPNVPYEPTTVYPKNPITFLAWDDNHLLLEPPAKLDLDLTRYIQPRKWELWGATHQVTNLAVAKPLPVPHKMNFDNPNWDSPGGGHTHYFDEGVNIPGAWTVTANNDEWSDLVELVRYSDDLSLWNGWGGFLARSARLIKGTSGGGLAEPPAALVLDGGTGPFLQFLPIDQTGDGIVDYLYCRATDTPPPPEAGWCLVGYHGPKDQGACDYVHPRLPTGRWYLAEGSPSGTIASVKQLGSTICDAQDRLLVIDRDGDGIQDLLVSHARYQSGDSLPALNPPYPAPTAGGQRYAAQWQNYQALRLDPVTHDFVTWVATDLPVDRFQRFMTGAIADLESSSLAIWKQSPLINLNYGPNTVENPLDPGNVLRLPFRGGGLGMDRVADLNGDGLADIARTELCYSADPGSEPDTTSFTCGDGTDMLPWIRLTADPSFVPDSHYRTYVRVWLNTGRGFVQDHDFAMSAAFWSQYNEEPGAIVARTAEDGAATLLDANGNGTTDILSGWTPRDYLELKKSADDAQMPPDLDVSVDNTGNFKTGLSTFRPGPTMDLNRDGQHDVVMLLRRWTTLYHAYEGDPLHWGGKLYYPAGHWEFDEDPYPRFHTFVRRGKVPDLLVNVRNGLGHDTLVAYAPTSDDSVYTDDTAAATYPTTRVQAGARPVVRTVARETVAHDQANDPYRITRYRYANARADRHGRGYLGFGVIGVDERDVDTGFHASVETEVFPAILDPSVKDYPARGFVKQRISRTNFTGYPDGQLARPQAHIETTTQTHERKLGPAGSYTPYLATEAGKVYEVQVAAGAPCAEGRSCTIDEATALLQGKTPITHSTYTVSSADEHGYPLVATTFLPGKLISTRTTYEHRPTQAIPIWQKGLVTRVTTTESILNGPETTLTSSYEYNDKGSRAHAYREPGSQDPSIYLDVMTMYLPDGTPFMVRQIDAGGHERWVSLSHDAEGNLLSVSNALGHTTTVLHRDPRVGLATHVRGPNGEVLVTQVDKFGRPIGSQVWKDGAPISPKTTASYALLQPDDWDSEPLAPWRVQVQSTTEGGGTTQVELDAFGRPVFGRSQGFDGSWLSSRREFGHRGEIERESLPWKAPATEPAGWLSYDHDGLGRVVRAAGADGGEQLWRYGPHTVWRRDEEAHWSRVVRDELGQIARTLDGMPSAGHAPNQGDDPSELCFAHGPFGRVERTRPCAAGGRSWTGPQGTTLGYDRLNRRTSIHSAETGTAITTYNAWSQPLTEQDAGMATNWRHVAYEYDPLGRLVTRSLMQDDDVIEQASWDWDSEWKGALTSATSETGHLRELRYYADGRLQSKTDTIHGEVFRFEYGYDPFGHLEVMTYPQPDATPPLRVRYEYNPLGFLERALDADSGEPLWTREATDAAGRTTRERLGNDLVTTRTFDELSGRLEWIETRKGDLLPMQWLHYDWYGDGQLEQRTDEVTGQVERYHYDEKKRLTGTDTCNGQICQSEIMSYDPWGALTYKSNLGAYTYTPERRLATAGALVFPVYDANGDMRIRTSASGTSAWTYNARRRPVEVDSSDGETLRFEYDADDNRVYRYAVEAQTETVSLSLYERERVGPAVDQEITHRSSVIADGRVVAQVQRVAGLPGETLLFLHDDHLGTTDLVTGPAVNGVIPEVDRLSFDAWGLKRDASNWLHSLDAPSPTGMNIGFTGHTERTDAELIHMRGRMYDPVAARFVQPDPFVQSPADMRSHERYSYAWNSPATLVDPSGFTTEGDTMGGLGGGSGGAVGLVVAGISCLVTQCWKPEAAAAAGTSAGMARSAPVDHAARPASPAPAQSMASPGGGAGQRLTDAQGRPWKGDPSIPMGMRMQPFDPVTYFADSRNRQGGGGAATAQTVGLVSSLILGGAVFAEGLSATFARHAIFSETSGAMVTSSPASLLFRGTGEIAAEAAAPPGVALGAGVAAESALLIGGSWVVHAGVKARLPEKLFRIVHNMSPGSNENCPETVIAVGKALRGGAARTVAPSIDDELGDVPWLLETIAKNFGRSDTDWQHRQTLESIVDALTKAGDGAHGIVAGRRFGAPGHVFNAVNHEGVVYLIDGQTGGLATIDDFMEGAYSFLRDW